MIFHFSYVCSRGVFPLAATVDPLRRSFASIVHICTFFSIVEWFTVCLFRCLYLMAAQKVLTSVTLAHSSNSTVCISLYGIMDFRFGCF